MLKFTEKIGEREFTYEGETVQDIVNLKQAINPEYLVVKFDTLPKEDYDRMLDGIHSGSIRQVQKVGATV